jgi:hypothetical protein
MRPTRLLVALPLLLASRPALADPPPPGPGELPPGYEKYAAQLPASPASDSPWLANPTYPYGYRPPEMGTERRSLGMLVSGIILASVGVSFLPIGTVVALSADRTCEQSGNAIVCKPGEGQMVGLGMLIGATASMAAGISLSVLGSQRVPIEPLRIEAGLGHVGVRWQF